MNPSEAEAEVQVHEYLDDLRSSGVTNMLGAGAYLQRDFGLGEAEARTILVSWMKAYMMRQAKAGGRG